MESRGLASLLSPIGLPAPGPATRASTWLTASAFPRRDNRPCRLAFDRKPLVPLRLPLKRNRGSPSVAAHTAVDAIAQPLVQTDVSAAELHSHGDRLLEILCNANVYLIGMMGCGKTTVGKILSESLGYYFFDSDTVVEHTAGTSVAEIFAKHGEPAFRDLETQAIRNLSAMDGLIVATGGGAIIRPENWSSMRNGIVVWLDVPLPELASRVVRAGVSSRPLVDGGENDADPYAAALTKLNSIFEKRQHLYPQADLRLSFTDIAARYEVGSVSAVTPNMIASELIKGITLVLEARHMSNEFCPLDPSWADEEVLAPLPSKNPHQSAEAPLGRVAA